MFQIVARVKEAQRSYGVRKHEVNFEEEAREVVYALCYTPLA